MDKATGFMLNRKRYQEIRKYDHNQMTQFLANLYREGVSDGKKSSEGLTMDELREAVLQVKGIGEKKAAEIVAIITEKLAEKNGIDS